MSLEGTTSSTITGYFEDHASAERAVTALRQAGFTSAHLGVAHRGASESTQGAGVASTVQGAAGAVSDKAEGVWDKVKGFFTEGDVEPYADEKQSGDFATHEITEGYGHSDVHGSMTAMNVPEDRSRYMADRLGNSERGAIVTVKADGREDEVETILRSNGADLGDTNALAASTPSTTANLSENQNIQLLGETLRVHKDRVSAGEVRLRKETITEMQTIQVPVTREELVIERHAVSGQTPATGTIGDTGEIRIPLTEERASLDKSTFVREEVSVGKRSVESVRELSDQVRHEDLVVEDETVGVDKTNNR